MSARGIDEHIVAFNALKAGQHGGNGGRDGERAGAMVTLAPLPFPLTLGEDAFHGLAGDIVRAILPHTEADAAGLLANTLVMFGSAAGGTYHAWADGYRHGGNLFAVTVGETNTAKGTATQRVFRLYQQVDPDWATKCRQAGLSSGEGLISAVRTPEDEAQQQADPSAGRERRLFIVESEFGGTLRIMAREGNSLSSVLRQAWDGADLCTMTKEPMRASGAHISIIGHVTPADLRRRLSETDALNGFANRFLWVRVGRSKLLSHGGGLPEVAPLVLALRQAVQFARAHKEPVVRDVDAEELWDAHYRELTATRPESVAAIVARAAPQALRLSLLYAAMDRSAFVRVPHLKAALALWRYCEDSATQTFGGVPTATVAERLLTALRIAGEEGLSLTGLTAVLQNHVTAAARDLELDRMREAGLIRRAEAAGTGTKARVMYYAVPRDGEGQGTGDGS